MLVLYFDKYGRSSSKKYFKANAPSGISPTIPSKVLAGVLSRIVSTGVP